MSLGTKLGSVLYVSLWDPRIENNKNNSTNTIKKKQNKNMHYSHLNKSNISHTAWVFLYYNNHFIYRTLYSTTEKSKCFSSTYGTLTKVDLGDKASLFLICIFWWLMRQQFLIYLWLYSLENYFCVLSQVIFGGGGGCLSCISHSTLSLLFCLNLNYFFYKLYARSFIPSFLHLANIHWVPICVSVLDAENTTVSKT